MFIHFNPNQMAKIIRNPSEIIVKNPVQSPETWHFLLILPQNRGQGRGGGRCPGLCGG
jgi:hypothetical protein